MSKKPVVYYVGIADFDTSMFPGHEVAHVLALNHPKWGYGRVRTSSILEHFDDGFETMNTIYKEKKNDNRSE
jgi:hypothetical protein